jgi:hypothetical protein
MTTAATDYSGNPVTVSRRAVLLPAAESAVLGVLAGTDGKKGPATRR